MVWQRQLFWRRPRRPKGARHAKKHAPGRHACGRGKGAPHMKIIIAGDGKVGLALTRQLLHEGHELVVIDSNRSVLGRSLEKYDLLTVPGNAAALGTLREAGAADADLLIAATSTDETNILCCLVAKRLNPRLHTIARVRSYEYAEQLFLMREELGLSMSVNPELAAASEIFRLLQFPSFIQRETFAKGRVEIVELRVDEGSRLCGVPLSQLDSITRVKVLVCAVTHGGAVTIPNGNYVLAAGDHIHVTAAGADLARLLKNLGIMRRRVRQVMLVGGGRITYYLAKRLLQSGVGVKIIEIDAKRAVQLADENMRLNFGDSFPHTTLACDAVEYLKQIGDRYDLIILDPPAFAKHHKVLGNAMQGYKRLNARALSQIRPGGILFTFSCSQAVTKELFRTTVFSAAAIAGRNVRILHQLAQPADHPINIYHPEGEYLKGLVLYVE